MKFECDSCHAQYMIADEKVGKRGVKVKCKKCQHIIIVRPDGSAPGVAAKSEASLESPSADPSAAAPTVPGAPEARPAMAASPRKGERTGERASPKSAVKKAADKAEKAERAAEKAAEKQKAAVELPLPTLAAPPPPGLDFGGLSPADNEGTDAFAVGGPTDPSANAMRGMTVEPPPPPPASDEGPETTGPNMHRPAPISMFGDQTQLTQNPLGGVSEESKKLDDRTELGQPPQMSVAPRPDSAATQVTQRDAPRDPPAPPPAPPAMAMPSGPVAAMPATGGDDVLGDQLNGAFNAMFDAAPAADLSAEGPGDQRGPTRILDAGTVDALRKNAFAQPSSAFNEPMSDDHGLGDEGFVVKPAAAPASGADDGPPDQVWHVAIDDQDVGPLSLAEVGRHIEGGRVDRESLVWKTGMDDWIPAAEVPSVRALFDKVPMPRIARVDDEPRASSGFGMSGDLGPPIDDGGSPPPTGASPFDDGDDPSWRPHGLTDVYQAANLAETAGAGMGGMGMGMAIGASSSKAPSPSMGASAEPEWRPAAASALASLVNDEIKRLDNGPPPATDDDLSPADDASINAPLFGGMGVDNTLEAGPEVSDPMGRAPAMATRGPSFDRAQPAGSFPPSQGFMSTPPQPRLSPLVIGGIAGGALLVLVLVVLVAVVALNSGDNGSKIVMVDNKPYVQGPDGNLTPLNPEKPAEKAPVEAAPTPKAPDALAAAPIPTTPTPTPAEGVPPTDVNAEAPKGDVVAANTPPPEREKKVAKPREKRDDPPKRPDPPPKVTDKPKKDGDCDPVLDFDCKAGKPSASSEKASAKVPPKEALSKADVLVVVKSNMAKVEGCGRKNKVGGVIKMSWKIQPSGKTSDVQVADSKFAGTPVGTCVASEIKGWKFPASKASTPVSFPMKLGG